jgi:hypothetical protein
MKFPIDRIPSCLIFEFWDFGRIMAVGHWIESQNRESRVFSSSPWNFWSIEHNYALYWKFGTLAGLGSRPQAQMTMGPIQKSFLALKPFEGALTCSILIAGTQVMLRKAYFLRRWSWLRPESKISNRSIKTHTPTDLCSKFQLSWCYTGREIGHRQTDGRMDDITISVEPIFFKMCSKNRLRIQKTRF